MRYSEVIPCGHHQDTEQPRATRAQGPRPQNRVRQEDGGGRQYAGGIHALFQGEHGQDGRGDPQRVVQQLLRITKPRDTLDMVLSSLTPGPSPGGRGVKSPSPSGRRVGMREKDVTKIRKTQ
jgi:hypothetical protein